MQTVNGVGQFYDRQTGLPFTPRGNNFIRLAQENPYYGGTEVYHSTFNVGLYDPNDAENQLAQMQMSGYNTVRVFTSCCCPGELAIPAEVYPGRIWQICLLPEAGGSHGLFVVVTGDSVPETGGYNNLLPTDPNFVYPNIYYLTQGGVNAYSKFWTDLVTGLSRAKCAL